jgi:hypothetical protein
MSVLYVIEVYQFHDLFPNGERARRQVLPTPVRLAGPIALPLHAMPVNQITKVLNF